MKRGILVLLLVIVTVFCMGMGGLGGQPEGTVPETDIRIQVDITDRSGTTTNLNQFSMDGQTYLDAWHGQGKLTIPFQHIDTVTFGESGGDAVMVEAKLKSGNVMSLKIRSNARFYGSTGFGAFRIKAGDVAVIDFP